LGPARRGCSQFRRTVRLFVVNLGVIPPQTLKVVAAVFEDCVMNLIAITIFFRIAAVYHPECASLWSVHCWFVGFGVVTSVGPGRTRLVESRGGNVEVGLPIARRIVRRTVVGALQNKGFGSTESGDVGSCRHFETLAAALGHPVASPQRGRQSG